MNRPRPDWRWQGDSWSPIVRSKVEWADHHRQLFHQELERFRDRKPYVVSEDLRMYEGKRYRVLTAEPERAPNDLGMIFSDFVQNLRAALDYLIGELRADGPSRNSQFPITLVRPRGPHGFRRRQCVALAGIPDDAVKLIHWMQPYHRPDLADPVRHVPGRRMGLGEGTFRDALRAVELLWNISKHRTLFVVTAVTAPRYVGRERSGDEAEPVGFRMRGHDFSSEIWLPLTEPEESFDPHFEVNVTLAKPRGFSKDWLPWIGTWEAEDLMDHLHRAIRYEVLPQFNQYMERPGPLMAHVTSPNAD
jgi:hypothetical protein